VWVREECEKGELKTRQPKVKELKQGHPTIRELEMRRQGIRTLKVVELEMRFAQEKTS